MGLVEEVTQATGKSPISKVELKSESTDSIILQADVKANADDGTLRRVPRNGNNTCCSF
jgi:hypothetical protein